MTCIVSGTQICEVPWVHPYLRACNASSEHNIVKVREEKRRCTASAQANYYRGRGNQPPTRKRRDSREGWRGPGERGGKWGVDGAALLQARTTGVDSIFPGPSSSPRSRRFHKTVHSFVRKTNQTRCVHTCQAACVGAHSNLAPRRPRRRPRS